ncbi:Hypothetical protein FKW44_007291 [Caligus rogercresseyi]|uniref:Uncharacterized protein n=1 Tax=Caligus rogercresseyi TaxID=217165 RepID=A0A7T8QTG9_CALRO|nr:Hypothetical protein FKW44_007291 [Caligus rogercresseyi]
MGWPPRQWPWRPGNAFTPTTVARCQEPGGDFVFPIPRERPMRVTTHSSSPSTRKRAATFACHAISEWTMIRHLRSGHDPSRC